MAKIKRYFITGLLVVLPVFITLYVLFIMVRFIDGIWGKVINFYLRKYLGFGIPGLGFILGILTVFAVGFVATNFFGKRIFRVFESGFIKFPMIRQIYLPAKQIVNSFFAKDRPAFKKVALVEYPSKGLWSMGFVTNESFRQANEAASQDLIHILIATTPSPLTGFLILVPRSEVKYLDISVEEGIRLIVSGGIVKPQEVIE